MIRVLKRCILSAAGLALTALVASAGTAMATPLRIADCGCGYGYDYPGAYGYDDLSYYQDDRDGYWHDGDWGNGYRHYVCDPDGDRCYISSRGYWDYHEYYRRHGYRWQ